jgi:hypothetical protein
MILGSCSEDNVDQVSIREYSTIGNCWKDKNGKISSFIIFANTRDGKFVPYLVSYKCIEKFEGDYNPYTLLFNIGAIEIAGDNGKWKSRGFVSREIATNAMSHAATPSDEDQVYIFRGRLATKRFKFNTLYEIEKIDYVKRSGKKFKEFAFLSPEQRFRLFQNIDKVR